ncbi:hypothetical protein ACIHFE_11905 [Streptomyces sp. NPDC052396]|uniref:hypothetical protein n=1 Tax=Streptomyces sp. NPDC052396 TaxID=3365689 RepID=UPI0037D74DCE
MWGWRRTKGQWSAEAGEILRDTIERAMENHRLLDRAYQRLADALEQVRSLLGHGDGLPADTVRARLATVQPTLDNWPGARASFDRTVAAWRDPEGVAPEAVREAIETFAIRGEGAAALRESVDGAAENLLGLRDKLLEIRARLAPLRERAHAALTAARAELSGSPELDAAEEQLHALDTGQVAVEPNRRLTDAYRDVELRLTALRGAPIGARGTARPATDGPHPTHNGDDTGPTTG